MINIKDKAKCNGCHACANICPNQCIDMCKDDEGFLYPSVNTQTCIECRLCEKVCPVLSPGKDRHSDICAYAAYNRDEDVRHMSSSGGVFFALAKAVLDDGGAVFGAVMNEDMVLSHTYIRNHSDLPKLCGSKYVQSSIGNAYRQVKEFLDEGIKVLFTGTPCQIEGLYRFLGGDRDGLLTADIVCHGVPSPLVFEKYIRSRKDALKIRGISFRDKSDGWRRYSLRFDKDSGESVYIKSSEDGYMKAFLKNLSLRPSCYECAFKKRIKSSDITLGDFWGVEHIHPEMDDDMGTSLVIVNSEKGKKLFSLASPALIFKATDIDEALRYNPSAIKASAISDKRESFMKDIKQDGFELASKRHLKEKLLLSIKRKLKKILDNKKRGN